MSTSPRILPKEDVAQEIGRVASTLTDDMQAAAVKKARELGFDLTRGRLSLEETLINLSSVRDVLLDAADKNKLIHLPLKLQYTLYSQTFKVSETLAALVNGNDSIQTLEEVVDDLMSSAWQYNLHNLSEEVLGFQQKMNQLKAQETLIRKAHREAQEFQASSERARNLLQEIEGVLTSAKERSSAINNDQVQTAAMLSKSAEAEQRVAGLVIQAEQHDSAASQHEANAKAASATAQTIADNLLEVNEAITVARTSVGKLEKQIKDLLSDFQTTSTTVIEDFRAKYEEVKDTNEAATQTLRDELTERSEQLAADAAKLLSDTPERLAALETDHDSQLNKTRDAINANARETIDKVDRDFQTALKDYAAKNEDQRTNAQKEHDRLVANLEVLEGQIKESIQRATGYTLFHAFQKRQESLVKSKNFWATILAGLVGVSLILSAVFIYYVNLAQNFGPAFYLKLSVSLPIIYAIWFCSVQYSRERRLEEEYAFKSSISISLDPYRELVEKLVLRDKPEELAKYTAFVIESIGRVFTSPTETGFDHTKDRTPTTDIIKATGDLTKDVIKLVK